MKSTKTSFYHSNDSGLTRQQILKKYYEIYGRTLDDAKLRKEILPCLETCGLIIQETDPTDKRKMIIYPTTTATTVASYVQTIEGNICGSHSQHTGDT